MADTKHRVIEVDWRWFQGEFQNVKELTDAATKGQDDRRTEFTSFGFPAPVLSTTESTSRAATPAR